MTVISSSSSSSSSLSSLSLHLGRFLPDPPGGVEALVQLSLALKQAAADPNEVNAITTTTTITNIIIHNHCEVYVTDNNYHTRWRDQYQDQLIMNVRSVQELQRGDIYIYSEGIACVNDIPEGYLINLFLIIIT